MARDDLKIDEGNHDVAAAGGVLLRRDDDGQMRVPVIHRPKYMDWSLPKGKLEMGESWKEAALREVEEETGYRAKMIAELPSISYLDRKGRRKLVRYWLMEPIDGEFQPHAEVDDLRWVTRDEADELLTYPHDRELVAKALRHWRRRRLVPWK
jgi:8-oxo-dGTP diphosphatase